MSEDYSYSELMDRLVGPMTAFDVKSIEMEYESDPNAFPEGHVKYTKAVYALGDDVYTLDCDRAPFNYIKDRGTLIEQFCDGTENADCKVMLALYEVDGRKFGLIDSVEDTFYAVESNLPNLEWVYKMTNP